MVIIMQKKEKKISLLRYNIIIIILCILLLGAACYISYDKYFGPTYNWFNYQAKHTAKTNCEDNLTEAFAKQKKIKEVEFSKVLNTFNNAKELLNSEKLLSPYVDIKINELNLSCKKIQKDLLTAYFSEKMINQILNSTLNNEFVDCIIKDTNENYGPRNIFNGTIFELNDELNPIALENNHYLTKINDTFLIFEKNNDIWKIKQY